MRLFILKLCDKALLNLTSLFIATSKQSKVEAMSPKKGHDGFRKILMKITC